jgi:hypothetical protein
MHVTPLDEDTSRRPLEYARPRLPPARMLYFASVAIVTLLSAVVAMGCLIHTVKLFSEFQSELVDAYPPDHGLPVEKSIPLGVFSGGVALVALVHFVRLLNGRRAARAAV